MRTRGERRRLTARAIKRKWSRYLQQFNGLVDGMYWSNYSMCWDHVHTDQHQPHRYNKKHIDNSPDHWPGRRHNMDWDAPRASEWEGWDEPWCTLGSKWSERCTCDECAYMDYLSFDPFDDTDMLIEYLLWDDIAVDSDVPLEEVDDLQYWIQFWEEE